MLFFNSLPRNATEYPISYRTDYCLPPPERRSSINNCPHRSGVGSYNNLRAYRPSSPTSTMQNPRFDRRRRPNYWSTVQLCGKMLHPNVAKPNVQSSCWLCVRSELADLTSTKPIVFASKLETHQRPPALGSSILSLEAHRSHHRRFGNSFCSYYYFCTKKLFAQKNLSFQVEEKSLKSRCLHKFVFFNKYWMG